MDEILTQDDTDLIAEFDEVEEESDVENEAGNVDEEINSPHWKSYIPSAGIFAPSFSEQADYHQVNSYE